MQLIRNGILVVLLGLTKRNMLIDSERTDPVDVAQAASLLQNAAKERQVFLQHLGYYLEAALLQCIGHDCCQKVFEEIIPLVRHHDPCSLCVVSVVARSGIRRLFTGGQGNDGPTNHIASAVLIWLVLPFKEAKVLFIELQQAV